MLIEKGNIAQTLQADFYVLCFMYQPYLLGQ